MNNNLACITTMECIGHGVASMSTTKEVWNHEDKKQPANKWKQRISSNFLKQKGGWTESLHKQQYCARCRRFHEHFDLDSNVSDLYLRAYYLTNKQLKRLDNNAVVNDAKLIQPQYNRLGVYQDVTKLGARMRKPEMTNPEQKCTNYWILIQRRSKSWIL